MGERGQVHTCIFERLIPDICFFTAFPFHAEMFVIAIVGLPGSLLQLLTSTERCNKLFTFTKEKRSKCSC